jgi:L-ribulose-5-phosphate 3-epimerase UlaE
MCCTSPINEMIRSLLRVRERTNLLILYSTTTMMSLCFQLLETLIKNCGDFVHMHVAEKDVLHEMVKIVKKKVWQVPKQFNILSVKIRSQCLTCDLCCFVA